MSYFKLNRLPRAHSRSLLGDQFLDGCKVYNFILDPRAGGPHTYVLGLKSRLHEFSCYVVTAGSGPATDMSLWNLRHCWAPLYLVEVFFNVLRLVWWVWRGRISRKDSVWVVHGAANLAPVIAAAILRQPTLWVFHETTRSYKLFVWVGLWSIRRTHYKLGAVARSALKIFNLPAAELLPAAIDLVWWDRLHRQRVEHPFLHLVAVGNLNPIKGQDVLLSSLQLKDKADIADNCILTIIGSRLDNRRDYADHLQEIVGLVTHQGTNCRIEFLGWQPSETIRNYLDKCDVFVLPSRSEACPIALLEAMAMGCACIATDVGDVAEILCDVGIVVPPDNPEAIALAIAKMSEMGAAGRSELGRKARERVATRHDLDLLALHHRDIYMQLLKTQGESW